MQQSQPSTNIGALAGGFTLGQEDVRRLMEDSSADARIYITEKIAGSYTGRTLDKQALIAAEQIFRLLLRDTETRVRAALSHNVKTSAHIPRDIVKSLARDVEEVSLPVLQFSEVLTENDLIEMIEANESVSRQMAISSRAQVPEKVATVLLQKGNEQVATTLVKNAGAAISEAGYGIIIDLHKGNETLMKSVSERPQMPAVVMEKLLAVVSSSLSEGLRKKYKAPAEQIVQEVEQMHEEQSLTLIRRVKGENETNRLVNQLQSTKKLTPSIILSALCQGNSTFFEMSLAKMSQIPLANVRTLIADQGELGFKALYTKAALPEGMFPAVKLLLRVVRELDIEGERAGSPKYADNVVDRILHKAELTPVENLSYVIALVRRVAK